MAPAVRHLGFQGSRDGSAANSRRHPRRAFTLVEMLVAASIILLVAALSAMTVRGLMNSGVLAEARNAVLTYAQVARTYAVANHIETMLVVNPNNGRFEIWHVNPPVQGGAWSPLSETDTAGVPHPDGYAFAPVLGPAACLPLNGGEPTVLVSPIDYSSNARPVSGSLGVEPYIDNFKWAAFCFDEHGQLVIRTRRIATRTKLYSDGTPRPANLVNRLSDGTPDASLRPLVIDGTDGDTPITSTSGMILSDFTKMKTVLDVTTVDAPGLVSTWLDMTRPGGRYANFAVTIALNRNSGDQLAKDK
jgi:prepilin-type N-terminal cleavage/methylation domain-containing protein